MDNHFRTIMMYYVGMHTLQILTQYSIWLNKAGPFRPNYIAWKLGVGGQIEVHKQFDLHSTFSVLTP